MHKDDMIEQLHHFRKYPLDVINKESERLYL